MRGRGDLLRPRGAAAPTDGTRVETYDEYPGGTEDPGVRRIPSTRSVIGNGSLHPESDGSTDVGSAGRDPGGAAVRR